MPAKIELTEEQLKIMYNMKVKERLNFSEIARRMGLSAQTVTRRLKNMHLTAAEMQSSYIYDKYYFYDINTAEKAYWLGFVTTDGYLNEDRKHFHLHLGWIDHEHLYKFKKALHAEMPVKKEVHNITGKFIATLNIDGSEFTNSLLKHNIHQRKSCKEIPSNFVPEEFIRDYIRGIIDGDGHIDRRKFDLRGSYEICSWVQKILMQQCNISKTKITFESNVYRLYVCKNKEKALEWLYYSGCKPIALERKYKVARYIVALSKKLPSKTEMSFITNGVLSWEAKLVKKQAC